MKPSDEHLDLAVNRAVEAYDFYISVPPDADYAERLRLQMDAATHISFAMMLLAIRTMPEM